MPGALPQLKKVMTASELLSVRERVRSEVSFQTFALNCCVPETLSEVVLGAVSSSVASVTDDRHDKFSVFLIVGEDAFEAVAQVVELSVLRDLRLEDAWDHVCRRHRPRVHSLVDAEVAATTSFEKVVRRCLGGQHVQGWSMSMHAGLCTSGCLGCHLNSSLEQVPGHNLLETEGHW